MWWETERGKRFERQRPVCELGPQGANLKLAGNVPRGLQGALR